MKAPNSTVRLTMPDDFDDESLDFVTKRASAFSVSREVSWKSFTAAWNAVAYRFRGADALNQQFALAMKAGDGPPPEERYEQEQALFGFCSACLSAVECLYFGAYCLGSLSGSTEFPITKEGDLIFYPKNVATAFRKAFPEDELTARLHELLRTPEFAQLSDLRNVLTHRGVLPRAIHLSVGNASGQTTGAYVASNPKSLGSDWVFERPINSNLTDSLRQWLGTTTNTLLRSTARFAASHLAAS